MSHDICTLPIATGDANNKGADQRSENKGAQSRQLTFVAYADCWFSHVTALMYSIYSLGRFKTVLLLPILTGFKFWRLVC